MIIIRNIRSVVFLAGWLLRNWGDSPTLWEVLLNLRQNSRKTGLGIGI